MTAQAYRHGTYSKIQEFLNFQRRLEDSVQRSILLHQSFRHRLLLETSRPSHHEAKTSYESLEIELSGVKESQFQLSGIILSLLI